MKRLTLILVTALVSILTSGIAAQSPETRSAPRPPGVGDVAPPFTLQGSDGRTYRLADYRGKQVVVLAWFARAFSGG